MEMLLTAWWPQAFAMYSVLLSIPIRRPFIIRRQAPRFKSVIKLQEARAQALTPKRAVLLLKNPRMKSLLLFAMQI